MTQHHQRRLLVDHTLTVGAAGDFATIQDAVNQFKGKTVLGACIIEELDAASYDEAVVFEDIFITPGSTLTLRGDTRTLAALSYIDGSIANRAGLANGGTFNNANRCTLTVNAAGDQITVSGGTVDPDFDDATTGVWGDGDWILVFGNDDTIYEREVNAILGVNDNIIELKVALPGAAFPGGGGALDDGSAVYLMPNREINRTIAGQCILVNETRGLIVDGFHLESHTGAACNGLEMVGGLVTLENVGSYAEDRGLYVNGQYGVLMATNGALSTWGSTIGIFANNAGQAKAQLACVVGCTSGVQADNYSSVNAIASVVSHATEGFVSRLYSYILATACGARQNNWGYRARWTGYIYAAATIANNNGNVTDYAPNPGGVGSAQDADFATIYSS